MRTVAGLDLCDDVTQISLLSPDDSGGFEVVTRPVLMGAQKYCIPTVAMKVNDKDEWMFGEDAKRAPEGFGTVYEDLIELAVGDESKIPVLSGFIRHALKGVTFRSEWPAKPMLFITLRRLDSKVLKTVRRAVELLELNDVDIRFLSHAESYFYYSASQAEELRFNKVCLIDYDGKSVRTGMLSTNRNMKPNVTFIDERQFELPEKNDIDLLRICREVMDSEVISSVYLAGTGFDGDWAKETVKYLCDDGRRVFQGMNLYTKGACYAAMDVSGIKKLESGEIFLDRDKLKVNIGMDLCTDGQIRYRSLIDAGINWFEASSDIEVMLGREREIRITLTPISGDGDRCVVIRTNGIPERPERASRVSLRFEMLSVSELKVTVTDLGFGEIFPATGNEITQTINIEDVKGEAS
ncbi:MAG: hypothetical protein J5829_03115 [Lachnospiraceae bacterium]|nr:hypothetical protein [Lachnospiraceae bacterium]